MVSHRGGLDRSEHGPSPGVGRQEKEHHPVVIVGADWVTELGPEGGERGGRVIAEGPPKKLATRKTPTAAVLRALFESLRV
jgi:hypothetical protein